jgi:hypothetical protein
LGRKLENKKLGLTNFVVVGNRAYLIRLGVGFGRGKVECMVEGSIYCRLEMDMEMEMVKGKMCGFGELVVWK